MSASGSLVAEVGIERVSTFELFFDLVFVFTLTQLTNLVSHPHDAGDYAKTLLVFLTLMWIYGGYAWLTSNLPINGAQQRYFLFAAMAGFFVMALGIPDIFGSGGLPYAMGLLVVTAIHAGLFATAPTGGAQAIWRIAPFNFTSAGLVLAAAFVRPPWNWPFWVAAVGVLIAATLLRRERQFPLSPAHFVERNGLLIIVALGESIVDVGVGAQGVSIDATLITSVVLALFLSASIWRTYFDRDDSAAEHTFAAATPAERGRMALLGFGYTHFLMIFGIIVSAAGLKVAVAHPVGGTDAIGVWNLAAGLALYLIGDVLYRRILHIGPGRVRLLVAALVLLTVPLGLIYGAMLQMAACVLLFLLIWPLERMLMGRTGQEKTP